MAEKNKGFALVELLVALAIIALLAAVVIVSLTIARARDSRRRADLRQIATALALYYDTNSVYPLTGLKGVWFGTCSGYESKGVSGANGWVPNLAPAYITILPVDPKPVQPNGCYLYRSNGADYKLLANSTVESRVRSTDELFDPKRPHTYSIFTAGAKDW